MFKLSKRSLKALEGVHPNLVSVVKRAIEITGCDFTVIEGVRTIDTQRKYFERGASRTMNSRHLLQPDGTGHAVDIYPYLNGSVQCEASYVYFKTIANAMKDAAAELGFKITWGGDWKSFQDTPHFQLELS